MSRSVKDLRELINISRLSFHGEEDTCRISDEEDARLSLDNKPSSSCDSRHKTIITAKSKVPASDVDTSPCTINSRFKPLPPINTSTSKTTTTDTATVSKHVAETLPKTTLYEKSYKAVLEHIDADAVNAWLVRANDTVHLLSNWIWAEGNFARFPHFWLSEITKRKQRELVELETEIIVNEIEFALKNTKHCKHKDIMLFFQAILWEYPEKLCGTDGCMFLLDTLLILASGKKEGYRRLLANVKSSTKNPEHIHRILAARAFSLISIVASVVNFCLSLSGKSLLECKTSHRKSDGYHLNTLLVVDAIRLGYIDVLEYFITEQQMGISDVEKERDLSVLFLAVSAGQHDMVEFLLKVLPDVDINQVSTSTGNSLLHVAVNSGNIDLVQILLTAGANVNQVNCECDNATPLHLAVMQGDSALVSVLLQAGANVCGLTSNDSMSYSSPMKLAQDLGMTELVEIMTASYDADKHN